MPKTIITISTMMCPTGLGNPNASCRFHRASDNLPPDNMCPTCKKTLVKSTDPLDKITMTVMGEEDIETEIEQIKDRKQKGEKTNDPDISTIAKENAHRNKRKADIVEAIKKAKVLEDK